MTDCIVTAQRNRLDSEHEAREADAIAAEKREFDLLADFMALNDNALATLIDALYGTIEHWDLLTDEVVKGIYEADPELFDKLEHQERDPTHKEILACIKEIRKAIPEDKRIKLGKLAEELL